MGSLAAVAARFAPLAEQLQHEGAGRQAQGCADHERLVDAAGGRERAERKNTHSSPAGPKRRHMPLVGALSRRKRSDARGGRVTEEELGKKQILSRACGC